MPFFVPSSKIEQLESEIATLRQLVDSAGGQDAFDAVGFIATQQAQISKVEEELAQRSEELHKAEIDLARFTSETDELRRFFTDANTYLDFGLVDYTHPAKNSVELSAQLEDVRRRIKETIRNKKAATSVDSFTFNNSKTQGRKFVNDMTKMMLRAYNAEAENCVLTVKAGNGEAAEKRLTRAKEQAQKLGSMINLNISYTYHQLRLRELKLALEFQNAKKAEKEAEREERARLREEKQAQKELEQERAKLFKERTHYENVLAELLQQGKEAEAAELRSKLDEVSAQIESVDFRAANQRAGYVYVISNIGAFGDNMVKIGMTRRLVPIDRVRELSDASVPFNFDVHALFFTENAVGVEYELHQRFADRRVNLINMRREFFAVSPLEVKDALLEIAGNLLEFVEEPDAEQYRQSLSARKK